jgi:mRNA-degrading endonuclease RelE of RelBE toxin-antitoxin system
MTGSDPCRRRAGDYRVIYRFELMRAKIYLVAIGHRREIYRD